MKFYCLLLVVVGFWMSEAVDRSKFRKCSDTGFCKRYRYSPSRDVVPEYKLEESSLVFNEDSITGIIYGGLSNGNHLNLAISPYQNGPLRVTITENERRWQPNDILLNPAQSKYIVLSPDDSRFPLPDAKGKRLLLSYGDNTVVSIQFAPFRVDMFQNTLLVVSVNSQQLMHFEHRQRPHADSHAAVSVTDRHGGKEVVDYGEDGLATYADGTREERAAVSGQDAGVGRDGDWEESFGGHQDSKPMGPMSVGLDFAFPLAHHVYGIPQHASGLSLQTTTSELNDDKSTSAAPHYKEPYRLYNLDVFEYELDETMALYGHIPLMVAHGIVQRGGQDEGITAGVFWFNPTETFIDVAATGHSVGKRTHWMSETGDLDFFLLPGPSPPQLYRQYTSLTGTQQLPPMFSLGYHQCRWNYRDEKDVADVHSHFEDLDFPVDVIWLDIEHTNGKRYFSWDKKFFPTPLEMLANISSYGRKMVTIVDPHIKRDDQWSIHKEATQKGLYIKDRHGNDFDGWCWPGSSSYLDFTDTRVREWWASQFDLSKYEGSTLDLFTWNDMNEPSVFNGPEVSMGKDCVNLQGVEHRYWHNLYGLYMQRATAEGLTLRDPARSLRPFVLSRAFWAGSQRYGAIWTGDNKASWAHLKIASPMLLSIGLAGLAFAGADVGGFFGEPSAELFTRWYQAGAFTPFFRGHAHLDTKRREPWVHGEPHTSIRRASALVRYSLLPYLYTMFFDTYNSGVPVMRAMFSEFPNDGRVLHIDDQWMLGDALLVKPVTDEGKTSTEVMLPGAQGWYDFTTLSAVVWIPRNGKLSVPSPLESIPVFVRGGHVIVRKMRLRRSSKLMFFDPLTLMVAPDFLHNSAEGYLYMDDEATLDHERLGLFCHRKFSFSAEVSSSSLLPLSASLSSTSVAPSSALYQPPNVVERIVIGNQVLAPKKVELTGVERANLSFIFDTKTKTLTIKKPNVSVSSDWSILITW